MKQITQIHKNKQKNKQKNELEFAYETNNNSPWLPKLGL